MSNMEHCRFENTAHDLADCYDHWDDDLSEFEEKARKRILRLARKIVDDYEEFTIQSEDE
jgi:hypothetical protein